VNPELSVIGLVNEESRYRCTFVFMKDIFLSWLQIRSWTLINTCMYILMNYVILFSLFTTFTLTLKLPFFWGIGYMGWKGSKTSDWGTLWHGACWLVEKLRRASKDSPEETFERKFVIIYCWELDYK